jgi:hypothetical protein
MRFGSNFLNEGSAVLVELDQCLNAEMTVFRKKAYVLS